MKQPCAHDAMTFADTVRAASPGQTLVLSTEVSTHWRAACLQCRVLGARLHAQVVVSAGMAIGMAQPDVGIAEWSNLASLLRLSGHVQEPVRIL